MRNRLYSIVAAALLLMPAATTEPPRVSADPQPCGPPLVIAMLASISGSGAAVFSIGCDPFTASESPCPITAIGADVSRDGKGNRIDEVDFHLSEPCPDVHVTGAFAYETGDLKEKLVGSSATLQGSWRCTGNPWIAPAGQQPSCTRLAIEVDSDKTDWDPLISAATSPISVTLITSLSREYLAGQTRNAFNQLPGATPLDVITTAADPKIIRIITRGETNNAPKDTTPAAPVAPTVQKGATGPRIQALQELLIQSGESVVPDGLFDDLTETAVRSVQRKKNLTQDGKVSPQTWAALWVTLRKGSPEDDAVQAAQILLNWHKADLDVDGDFGDLTDAAVKAFQRAENLPADGVVNSAVWVALVNAP